MSKYKLSTDAVAAWDALAAQYAKEVVDALSSFQLQRLDYCLKTKNFAFEGLAHLQLFYWCRYDGLGSIQ